MNRPDDERDDYRRGPDHHADAEADRWHPGDALAAADLPPYPTGWDSARRVEVYWHALRIRAVPHTTKGWEAVAAQLDNARSVHEQVSW
jgi:hypothetical protein